MSLPNEGHDLSPEITGSLGQAGQEIDQSLLNPRSSPSSLYSQRSLPSSPPIQPIPSQANAVDEQPFEDVSEYETDSEEDQPPRSNKYSGPASTWRSWTAAERELAVSLDELRARDLSAHLYNSYALKRRARLRNSSAEIKQHQSKERWTRSKDGTTSEAWVPPKMWTAWPMKAEEVPREGERNIEDLLDPCTLQRSKAGDRRSEVLEQCLLAEFLRIAKETFEAREWSDEDESEDEGDHDKSSISSSESSFASDTSGNSIEESSIGADDISIKDEQQSYLDESKRPVFIADDGKARSILQPTIQHLLSQMDKLLFQLHRARQSHLLRGYSEHARPARTVPSKRKSPTKPNINKRKRRKLSTTRRSATVGSTSGSEYVGSSSDMESAPSSSRSSSLLGRSERTVSMRPGSSGNPSRSLRRRRAKAGLRDWSDVLGMASLNGWSTAAVQRAAERCGNLFGEGMAFRTLELGKPTPKSIQVGAFHPGNPVKPEDVFRDQRPEGGASQRLLTQNEKLRKKWRINEKIVDSWLLSENPRFLCPAKDCKRHMKGFSRVSNLNNHVKRMHPWLKKIMEDLKEKGRWRANS